VKTVIHHERQKASTEALLRSNGIIGQIMGDFQYGGLHFEGRFISILLIIMLIWDATGALLYQHLGVINFIQEAKRQSFVFHYTARVARGAAILPSQLI